MAKFKSADLINELQEDVRRLTEAAQFFKNADKGKMVYTKEGKWSVVQGLEHLNAYGRYYLPEIEKTLAVKTENNNAWFQSGYWGEKFTKSMKPTNVYEIKNRMRAMKKYTFPNSLNVDTVLKEFEEQQNKLLQLLEIAKTRDLNTVGVPITLTKLIKLKIGDALRFLIAHEQRHMVQARNMLKTAGVATDKFPVILQTARP